MGELGYAQIRFFQITLGFADAVNVGIFADGIPGDLFKYPADIGFTEIKFRTEFFQRDNLRCGRQPDIWDRQTGGEAPDASFGRIL